MLELEETAIVKYGLSPSQFWDSTPRELDLLTRGSAYKIELGLNHVRHILAAIFTVNKDHKKRKQAYTPEEMMYLPLLDGDKPGRNNKTKDPKEEQKRIELGLKLFKEKFKL